MDPDVARAVGRVPHGGEPDPTVLDFSANVNPRTPDGVESTYADALEAARRYPDDDYPAFRAAAAEYVDCGPESVLPTPGGLAAIRLALEVTVEPGDAALVPYPSFGEYAREVRLQGATPLFAHHEDLLSTDERVLERCALAVVCTPNNPTGEAADPSTLADFARRCGERGTTLLVDEAFLGFADVPSLATEGLENAIVVRSLTKLFGLPGLRAGFAVAAGERRAALEAARPAWNLGTPAARVGARCLRDAAFVRETRERVARDRRRLREGLESLDFEVRPSDAPYLLCNVGDRVVDDVLATARDGGIALRDATTFRGLDSHVRVAVRERADNDRLLEVLADV